MTEQYGFKFVVDANDAAKGWQQFESAVDGVFRSLDRMEAHVEKTMGAVNRATKGGTKNLNAFTKAANDLGKVKVNPSASNNLKTLNAAMNSFKAPNATQNKNLRAFFKTLELSGRGGGATAAKNIAALANSLTGFKAPTAANNANLREFFKALAVYPSGKNFTNAAGMLSTLRQLQGFKAPTAAQVRNLQTFLTTVSNLKIPPNGAQVARNLEQIARAAGLAGRELRGLRGGMSGMPWRSFNTGARSATVNMMGLQNAFSGTFQIGSALRVLLGSLTIGELGRNFFEATNAALQFEAQMGVITKEAGFAGRQLEYVNMTANRFGIDMLAAEQGFAKISIAADKSGVSVAETRHIFEGMTAAMSVLGITTAGQGDVWLALQQVMNKGYLSAEELNQQLNEKLPGAMAYATEYANSLGMSLEKGLKSKALDAAGVLEHISKRMKEDFGPAVEQALDRPSAQMNILRNNFNMLFQSTGKFGGNRAVVDLLKAINEQMTPEMIERYGQVIGQKLYDAVTNVADAFRWLRENWDSIKGPLSVTLDLMGKWMIVTSTLQIGRFIVTPMWNAVAAFRSFIPVASQSLLLTRALTATSFAGFAASVRGMNPQTLTLLTNLRSINAQVVKIGKNPLTSLRTGLRGIGSVTDGVTGKFLKLGGVIGTGLSLAMFAARDANKEYAHDSYTTTEIVRGFFIALGQDIDRIWSWVTEKMVVDFSWASKAITGTTRFLQDFFKAFFVNLSFGFAKVGEGIVKAFRVAFDGVIGMIRQVGTALSKLFAGDFAGAGNAIMNVFKPGLDSFQSNFNGYLTDLPGQREQFGRDVEAGYGAISNRLAFYGSLGRDKEVVQPPKPVTEGPLFPGNEPPAGFDETDDGSGKKNKGRKGREIDPMRELDRLQRKADQIMSRLADNNPMMKVQQDFVNMVTENAQALLSDGGYTKWMEMMKDNTDGVVGALDLLQDAMEAGGQDQAVITDLALRYGVTLEDINDLLYKQADAYEYAMQKAREEMTFGFGLLKTRKEELQLSMLSASEARVMADVLEEVNRWKDTQNALDQEQIDLLTEQLRLQDRRLQLLAAEREFYENNGLRQFQNEIRTAGEMVHDLDYNFLGSLKDQLTSLGTTGKFSFSAIFDTVQKGLIEWSAGGITDAIGGMLSDKDPNNPSIFGGIMRKMGFNTGFDANKAMERINAQEVNLYAATVNPEGDLLTGLFGKGLIPTAGSGADGNTITVTGYDKQRELTDILAQPLATAASETGDVMKRDWSEAVGGIGGLFQSMFQGIFGNGTQGSGLFNAAMQFLPGIFKEGGYSTDPVARWSVAPHYAEGTHNTTPGIPAVLHDNEAVIPLSRNRKVPVTLTNTGGGGSGTVVNNNWNISTPNADSFRRSQQQVTGQMHRAAARAYSRNN
ncbi:tail tape-measure [Citromicrobium phage vB_CbaS-RXM]|nr:tail tape-measure [Citromicrobium phage vB_CbaS-RXM]